MAEEKKITKKVKTVKEPKAKKDHATGQAGKKTVVSFENKSVSELKTDLQKLLLDIRTGKEKNTSLVKKLKVTLARLKTKETQNKQ